MDLKNEFYNEELKQKFLNTIENDIARKFASYPLRKAKAIEIGFKKDLYDMTLEEVGEVLGNISCSTEIAAYNSTLILEKYIDWAIEVGYRESNINPLSRVNKPSWSKGYVAEYKNSYFTREHILDMMDQLVNETDKAVLLALFEGIKGTGYSELLNLKEEDIREKNGKFQARLKDKNGQVRVIEITERLAILLINTANRPSYINKNGATDIGKRYESSSFENSPMIFKKTSRGKQGGELDSFFVNRKFVMFKQIFGHRHLKTKHISDSGIMHIANELQEDGVLSTSNARAIAEVFNTSFTSANGERYRNLTIIKKIITASEFEELYGYKITL